MRKKSERKVPVFSFGYTLFRNVAKINEQIAMKEWEAANEIIREYNKLLLELDIAIIKINELEEKLQRNKVKNMKVEFEVRSLREKIEQMDKELEKLREQLREDTTRVENVSTVLNYNEIRQDTQIKEIVSKIIALFKKEPLNKGLLLQEQMTNIKDIINSVLSNDNVEVLGKIFKELNEQYNRAFEQSSFFRDDVFLRFILQPIVERKMEIVFGQEYDFCMRIMEIDRYKHTLGNVSPSDYYLKVKKTKGQYKLNKE